MKGDLKILVDSGIRSGLDVVRMLALGADCTMIGRSYIYALAAKGQAGVEQLLELYEKEMRVAMTLTGAKTLSDLSHDSLVQNSKQLGEVLNLPERNFIPELESA
ncbi:L-lactate dehydrogenase [Vibrio ishigakensis]|uniref:L-lactate dehydrogenase n=1 Tax=Vibrio ishigakensis TaxID=1481914 RepID=A0A0B8NWB8_9VIBR|nr:L-lactate dehydrogenase [Vibrio ishigakensis]GAM76344.1 L-lactate dehydrogenase [Vibrio ishigakensis]